MSFLLNSFPRCTFVQTADLLKRSTGRSTSLVVLHCTQLHSRKVSLFCIGAVHSMYYWSANVPLLLSQFSHGQEEQNPSRHCHRSPLSSAAIRARLFVTYLPEPDYTVPNTRGTSFSNLLPFFLKLPCQCKLARTELKLIVKTHVSITKPHISIETSTRSTSSILKEKELKLRILSHSEDVY